MSDPSAPGIYLIVNFDWPNPFSKAHGDAARALHDAVAGQFWIREAVAASGGLGGGPSSLWIFWLENYAALDRLLRQDANDPVGKAYRTFFGQMPVVVEVIRNEVLFL